MLLDHLLTEARNPASMNLDEMTPLEIVHLMNKEDGRAVKSVGAATVGLACNAGSEIEPLVDLMICPVVGPEVLSGSTRLKAGTATKLVLNMLTTGAMVRLGKCFGNLMVDLRATNEKLKARTNRIVRHLLGVQAEAADALLARCDGELKTALVVGRTGL